MKFFYILPIALIASFWIIDNAHGLTGSVTVDHCGPAIGITGNACINSEASAQEVGSIGCETAAGGCKWVRCRTSNISSNSVCGCIVNGECPELKCPADCPNRSTNSTNDPWSQVGSEPVWALCYGEKYDPICEYRCADGYYGGGRDYSYSSTVTCTKCPTKTGGTIGKYSTDGVVSTTITDCYIPAETNNTDTTGTWQFTQNCKYTQ